MKLSGISNKEARAFVRHLTKYHDTDVSITQGNHVVLKAPWMKVPSIRMSLTSSSRNQARYVRQDVMRAGLAPCERCPR